MRRDRYRALGRSISALLLLLLSLGLVLEPTAATGGPGPSGGQPTAQDDDDGGGDDDDDGVAPAPAPGGSVGDDDDGAPGVAYAALGGIVDDDGDPTTDGYRSGEVVVRLEPDVDIPAFTARHGARELASIPTRNVHLLQIPAGIGEDDYAEALLAADDAVAWAEPNGIEQAPEGRPTNFFPSADAAVAPPGDAYHVDLLGLDALATCATGAGTLVAVIDTGVDPTHPDLAGRLSGDGVNAIAQTSDTNDIGNGLDDDNDGETDEMTGHGTHVAGIIAQVAPEAQILPIVGLDSDGIGDAFRLAEAIYYAVDAGADVINLSLGSTRNAQAVADAVAEASDDGVIVVAAAGNYDRDNPFEYPAADPAVLGVAATDEQDAKSAFSNYGEAVSVSAPGTSIVSAYPGGEYASWSGTSMATPFISAAAALLVAANPEITVAGVTDTLESSAISLDTTAPDHVGELGAGRIDLLTATGCEGA